MRAARMHASTLALAVAVTLKAPLLQAQTPVCPRPAPPARTWVPLCIDGNGQAALQSVIQLPAGRMRISDALTLIAQRANVDLTMDARLPALQPEITLGVSSISAAQAVLQVIRGRPLQVFVMTGGGLSVTAADSPENEERRTRERAVTDSLTHTAQLARVVVTAVTDADRLFHHQLQARAVTLTTQQLASAPSFFGKDVIRTARLMPGLAARNDYSTSLNVRGGESDQTLILLDGIPIYHPFHVGGLFGTFIEPAVGGLDAFTGVFPMQYGERLSGILDVRSAQATRPGLHGVADLSLVASSASIGSSDTTSRTTWLLSARRTYLDAVAKLINQSAPFHFSDANLRATRELSNGAIVSLTAFAGVDVSTSDRPNATVLDAAHRAVGVTWSRTIGTRLLRADSISLTQSGYLTAFSARAAHDYPTLDVASDLTDARLYGAISLFGTVHAQTFGYGIGRQNVGYAFVTPPSGASNYVPVGEASTTLGLFEAWYEGRWQLGRALQVRAGGRVDKASSVAAPQLSPRISATLLIRPALALTAAAGRHVQWLHSVLREETPLRLLDFWIASDSAHAPATAWVYTLGLEQQLDQHRQLRVEAYAKQLGSLVTTNPAQDLLTVGDELTTEQGSSSGLDVILRQFEHNGFMGWVSYSFGISRRTTATGTSYSPAQDRRHDLNVVASWRSDRYRLGARFAVATGTPYTAADGVFKRERYDPLTNSWRGDISNVTLQYLPGGYFAERFPVSHRLDLSLTRMGLGAGPHTSPYLNLSNVYGQFNPAVYLYEYGTGLHRLALTNFRLVPSFGVRRDF